MDWYHLSPVQTDAILLANKSQRLLDVTRAVHSGGAKGAVAPARKTKCFFSNIVSDFAGLFLVAILVRNLTKTEFAPADKKS